MFIDILSIFLPQYMRSMHDVACNNNVNCMHSKDVQKQLKCKNH